MEKNMEGIVKPHFRSKLLLTAARISGL